MFITRTVILEQEQSKDDLGGNRAKMEWGARNNVVESNTKEEIEKYKRLARIPHEPVIIESPVDIKSYKVVSKALLNANLEYFKEQEILKAAGAPI